ARRSTRKDQTWSPLDFRTVNHATRRKSMGPDPRQHWGLGDRPIGNLLRMYESKGIRVLSLSENTPNVDAYSFWHDNHPYMFLNQKKTPERSNFDSAHELEHLVLHFHAEAETSSSDDPETQADQFASAFLVPEADVRSYVGQVYSASQVIKAKVRWRASAMALARRLYDLGMLSEWNHRSIIIELGKRGYRSGEPLGVEREKSTLLDKVLKAMWAQGLTKTDVASDLNIPIDEVETLVFDLAGDSTHRPDNPSIRPVD
ncbi:MAG: ImmA/IrrE family metallo-endopeptidase, partial [Pseudomonadota bacterium]